MDALIDSVVFIMDLGCDRTYDRRVKRARIHSQPCKHAYVATSTHAHASHYCAFEVYTKVLTSRSKEDDDEAGEEAELKAAFDDCDKDGNKQVQRCDCAYNLIQCPTSQMLDMHARHTCVQRDTTLRF